MRFTVLSSLRRQARLRAAFGIWLITCLTAGTPWLEAATRLVSTTGTDSGNCTGTPCRTISYGLTQAVSGDTVSVAAGTYASPPENFPLAMKDGVEIVGPAGAATTIINGDSGGLIFFNSGGPLTSSARLHGFTLLTSATSSPDNFMEFIIQGSSTLSPEIDHNIFAGDPNQDDTGIFAFDNSNLDDGFTANIHDNTFNHLSIGFELEGKSGGSDNWSPTLTANTFTGDNDAIFFTVSQSGAKGADTLSPIITGNHFNNDTDIDVEMIMNLTDWDTVSPTISGNTSVGALDDSISLSMHHNGMSSSSSTFNYTPTINNNMITEPGGTGISMLSSYAGQGQFHITPTINGNTVTRAFEDDVHVEVSNLSLDSGAGTFTHHTTINGNTITGGDNGIYAKITPSSLSSSSAGDVDIALTVDGNTISGAGNDGVSVRYESFSSMDSFSYASNVTITNNTIDLAGGEGISYDQSTINGAVSASVDLTIDGNTISRSSGDGINFSISEVSSVNSAATLNATVTNNSVTESGYNASSPSSGNGIVGEIRNNSGNGNLYLDMTVSNNTVTNNGGAGISLSASSNTGNSYVSATQTVSNNTIDLSRAYDGLAVELSMTSVSSGAATVLVQGNKISRTLEDQGLDMYQNFRGSSIAHSTTISDNSISDSREAGLSYEITGQSSLTANNISITGNGIQRNGNNGLYIESNQASVNGITVSCNTISRNTPTGVYVSSSSSSPAPPPDFGGGNLGSPGNNNILNNGSPLGQYDFVSTYNNTTVFAENNYWGTPDPSSHIQGLVDFLPVAPGPITSCGAAATLFTLTMTKSASVAVAHIGDPVTFTLTVDNSRPGTATDVVIHDALPGGFQFVSAAPGCSLTATDVSCSIGTLNSGDSATRTIVTTAIAYGSFNNVATVSTTGVDIVNNSGSATVLVTTDTIPTVGEWGLMILSLLLAMSGLWFLRKRRATVLLTTILVVAFAGTSLHAATTTHKLKAHGVKAAAARTKANKTASVPRALNLTSVQKAPGAITFHFSDNSSLLANSVQISDARGRHSRSRSAKSPVRVTSAKTVRISTVNDLMALSGQRSSAGVPVVVRSHERHNGKTKVQLILFSSTDASQRYVTKRQGRGGSGKWQVTSDK